MIQNAYQWTRKDKLIYGFSLLPFLAAFFATAYLLYTISILLASIFLILYLMGNFFQAGACTGCPYRGQYCPPVFGVYLGNLLSVLIYKDKEYDLKFINRHAKIGEVIMYITLLFPVYWLFTINWFYPIIYFFLILVHLAFFMPTQCEKCSYNHICPGGIMWTKCRKVIRG